MRQLKLYLFPSFVKEALDGQVLRPSQLDDICRLKDIFSDASVSKILYLNNLTRSNATKDDLAALNTLGFTWWLDRPTHLMTECKTKTLTLSLLSAMQYDGDELLAGPIAKSLHLYALPFDVVKMSTDTYGLIFKELIPVDGPGERNYLNSISMEHLLRQGIVDNAVYQSEAFTQYVTYL